MTTFFNVGDSERSPEMRHEIAEAVGDPVIFLEHDDRRYVACGPFEVEMFAKREDVVDEVVSYGDLGVVELSKDESFPEHLIQSELALRMLQKIGASSVSVPPTFPTLVSDHLRSKGIELV